MFGWMDCSVTVQIAADGSWLCSQTLPTVTSTRALSVRVLRIVVVVVVVVGVIVRRFVLYCVCVVALCTDKVCRGCGGWSVVAWLPQRLAQTRVCDKSSCSLKRLDGHITGSPLERGTRRLPSYPPRSPFRCNICCFLSVCSSTTHARLKGRSHVVFSFFFVSSRSSCHFHRRLAAKTQGEALHQR
jgi:hypothetical protein